MTSGSGGSGAADGSGAATRTAAPRRRATAPELTVIRWRDIPAQVVGKDGPRTAKAVLHRRFQVAIDRAAVAAGLHAASDYIGEWRRDARPCGPDLDAEVAAEAARLEAELPSEALDALARAGGVAGSQSTVART